MWSSILSGMGSLMGGMGGAGVGSATGGMGAGMEAMGGMGADQFAGMSAGAVDTGTAPASGLSMGNMAGLMGSGSGSGGQTGRALAEKLGMSALEKYKDMEGYANMGSIMSPVQGMQNMDQAGMKFQERPMMQGGYQNPYMTGLMGGM